MSLLELQRADPSERRIETAMIAAKTNVTKKDIIEE